MPSTKAQVVKRFRQATGMGWMESKLFLAGKSAELCERILRARTEQDGPTLHDPIEDDPDCSEAIETARKDAESVAASEIATRNIELEAAGRHREIREWPLGTCHRIWKLMKERLQREGVEWYSPAEMNPGHHFD